MTTQASVAVRNGMGDSMETTIGTAPKLQWRSGTKPVDCATAASGTLLSEMTLPSDWLAACSNGTKTKAGTWSGIGVAAGTIGHYRIVDNAGTTCHFQGSVTATGGGGDMEVDNTNIAVNQGVSVTSWSLTMPGA